MNNIPIKCPHCGKDNSPHCKNCGQDMTKSHTKSLPCRICNSNPTVVSYRESSLYSTDTHVYKFGCQRCSLFFTYEVNCLPKAVNKWNDLMEKNNE